MSEAKMISPMLDNFIMGGSMSEHHGVRCYPAIENETGDRYIVKVISVPSNPSQMDALLLTGACPDKDAALAYFKELTDGVVREVDILEKLAELEGYIAYKACQIEPMESGEGYDIYLLGSYKRTLQKHFTRHSFTHLDALNLGLDLCAALSVCRRLGYLYIDLKPSNVFVTDQRLFRIGDLGFIPLDSLKYASVPEKYISVYTPPEIRDAFSDLNSTMDIYAAGLILYQTYNNGELPFNDTVKPGDTLPAPLYADYEMSEIILKACAPNPEDRWQDPMQMGQAIISYMQRNGATDTPIVPLPSPEPVAEVTTDSKQEETNSTEEEIPMDASEDQALEETVQEGIITSEEADQQETTDDDIPSQDEESAFEEDIDTDEELPDYDAVTEEVTEMLNQADELAALDVPEPVIVPDHVDLPEPEPIPTDEETTESSSVEETKATIEEDPENLPAEEIDEEESSDVPIKKTHWVRNIILILAILGLLIGGFFYYKLYYLLPIDFIAVDGNMDTLTVFVTTDIDESLLKVVCSDIYGNKINASVIDGKAEFSGLVPNTAYSIKVVANGFHRLTGNAKTAYSTPVQTNVVQFDAVTGTTGDSAILSFTVEGPTCDKWTVLYSAAGEEERTATFASHMVTLTDLSVGKMYTFRLVPEDELYVTGRKEINFTPRELIKAENLRVTNCENRTLTAKWEAPEGISVESWSVHCFNDTYNQTIITADTTATFQDLDHTAGYTIEVKAAGMSIGQATTVSANAITAANFTTDASDPNKLIFHWSPSQEITEDGWLLRYSIIGVDNEATLACDTNTAVISPVVPNATYRIQLEDIKGNVLLGSQNLIKTGDATPFTKEFDSFTAKAEDLEFSMCRTPSREGWGRYDLSNDDYTTTFKAGQSASFLVKFQKLYRAPDEEVTILFVTRNQDGKILYASSQTSSWKDMWPMTYCKLNLPAMPTMAGEYNLEIYFNSGLVHNQTFTITE